jgi:hypothetical protein
MRRVQLPASIERGTGVPLYKIRWAAIFSPLHFRLPMARIVFLLFSWVGWGAMAAIGTAAHAGHPLVTEDTGTQGENRWQWEVNTDHTRMRDAALTRWDRQFNGTITRGVADQLDLAVNLPWLRHHVAGDGVQGGVGDLAVQAKWRFHDNGAGWSMGLRPAMTLPTGSHSKGLGNGRATAAVVLISSLEVGDWVWLVNGGYTFNGNKLGQRRHLWVASTAVLYRLAAQWTLAADVGAMRNVEDGNPRVAKTGILGLIWHANDVTDLDIGWRRSVGNGPAATTLGVGLTVRW